MVRPRTFPEGLLQRCPGAEISDTNNDRLPSCSFLLQPAESFLWILHKYEVLHFGKSNQVNLLAIAILSQGKYGVSRCTTRYLVVMAAADMMVTITDIILWRFCFYYYPQSFLDITYVCSVNGAMHHAAWACSVWFTVTFSFDQFVTICCQKLKTKYCTEKTATVVLATTCTLLCLKNIPFCFQYEPETIINNVPYYCITMSSYYSEPWWVALDWLDTVVTPLLPFTLILLLNALTVSHILVSSRVRKRLKGESKEENHRDPEMESRRKSVILLLTISGSFILLWLIYVVNFLCYLRYGAYQLCIFSI
ncbi:uncharacterized protein LOC125488034 [Rhincodon typus]|uniref:uncharacterized protein LOC125488034 n=1 Tax=Rhincodon typus TaxID=259920 RepID=UPI002030612B|nr:uncharacterized protein LOC125488034 [Rhincodon typus]